MQIFGWQNMLHSCRIGVYAEKGLSYSIEVLWTPCFPDEVIAIDFEAAWQLRSEISTADAK